MQEWHPDGDGLYLRARPKTGYLSFEGRRRPFPPYRVGPLAVGLSNAREIWREALVKMAQGTDPSAAKKAAKAAASSKKLVHSNTVEAALALFEKRHLAPNLRTAEAVARVLRKEMAAWKGRDIESIGPADIHTVLDELMDRDAPSQAAHLFAYLSKFFGWCVNRGLTSKNPCEGISKPAAGKPRDRVLGDRELALVWKASKKLGWPFEPISKLLILTGTRKSEIAEGRWPEIDFDAKLWRLPAERVKNKRAHDLPLSPPAVAILGELPRIAGEAGLVFSTNGRTPVSGFGRMKVNLDKAIAELNDGEPIPEWTIHDIRRSVASGMARLGVQLPVIERCLNHVSGSFGGIVGVYQRHSFADEMRAALDAWGRHVDAIVSGQPAGNVVELRAGA